MLDIQVSFQSTCHVVKIKCNMSYFLFYLMSFFISPQFPSSLSQLPRDVRQPFRNDSVREAMFIVKEGIALHGHHLMTVHSADTYDCMIACITRPVCKSANFLIQDGSLNRCKLNIESKGARPLCVVKHPYYKYLGPANDTTLDHCSSSPCVNGGTCTNVCDGPGYKCNCRQYNTGQRCEQWTVDIASCKDIYNKTSYRDDTAYTFVVDSISQTVFCHMSNIDGCGLGGWTLTMKMDGTKNTFHYDSALWTNKEAYNPSAGQTGFDNQKTKSSTYWGVSFTKLCMGMNYGSALRWIEMSYPGLSLHSLIASGTYTQTMLGRSTWKSLISGSSLQYNCNKEGFNIHWSSKGRPHARLGITSNQEKDCLTCDSVIGFGTGHGHNKNITCGNFCVIGCDGGNQNKKTFGYILVQ